MNDTVQHVYVDKLWSGEYDKLFDDIDNNYQKGEAPYIVLHFDGFDIMVGNLRTVISNGASHILDFDLAWYDRLTYINSTDKIPYDEQVGHVKVHDKLNFVENLSKREREREESRRKGK